MTTLQQTILYLSLFLVFAATAFLFARTTSRFFREMRHLFSNFRGHALRMDLMDFQRATALLRAIYICLLFVVASLMTLGFFWTRSWSAILNFLGGFLCVFSLQIAYVTVNKTYEQYAEYKNLHRP